MDWNKNEPGDAVAGSIARGIQSCVSSKGNPKLSGHDAYDVARHSIDLESAPKHVTRPRVPGLPNGMADDDDLRSFGQVLLLREVASQKRRNTERGEERPTREAGIDTLWIPVAGDVHRRPVQER